MHASLHSNMEKLPNGWVRNSYIHIFAYILTVDLWCKMCMLYCYSMGWSAVCKYSTRGGVERTIQHVAKQP